MAAKSLPQVKIQNLSAKEQTQIPVTIGHLFAAGDLLLSDGLKAGSIPLQVDVKATHADGSVRHAILSWVHPKLKVGETVELQLSKATRSGKSAVALAELNGLSGAAVLTIDGKKYSCPTNGLIGLPWLTGDVVGEWNFNAPFSDEEGSPHPHLYARFGVRYYPAAKQARFELTVENDWAFEPAPQNFTYDVQVMMGGSEVFSQKALTHYHHARWRKVFWTGQEPQVNILHDTSYLISTGALPNYDSVDVPEYVLQNLQALWNRNGQDLMGNGLVSPYMPSTGGRDDIGLIPAWQTTWLDSQDAGAKEVMLRTADLAGSFSAHYRDKNTGRPVSLVDYPYMTINGNPGDTWNPKTDKLEYFPGLVKGQSDTPYAHDAAHQPNMVYLPYLVTGDLYYLEELQFWASWNSFETNPSYRGAEKGIMSSEQVRGQAWTLRTLFEAAYITPDADPLKAVFTGIVDNNLDWYTDTYIDNPNPRYANNLGAIVNGFAFDYYGGTAIAPWQQDFFASAIGHGVDLGFTKARKLLEWVIKFPIGRMIGDGVCWTDAAKYEMKLRASDTSPIYGSMGEVYANNHTPEFLALPCAGPAMAAALGLKVGEMTGISDGVMGYPSNMQPALAYAADYGGEDGKRAWNLFMSRSVKPDYRLGNQFNIVPRSVKTEPIGLPTPSPSPAPATPVTPALKVGKAPGAGTWKKVGVENEKVSLPIGSQVRYGAEGKGHIYASTLVKEFMATNAAFGSDPAVNVVKQVDVFVPAKPATLKTPSNTLLKKLSSLVVKVVDPKTLQIVSKFSGVTASSTGIITVSGTDLTAKAVYAAVVEDAAGNVIDIMYPVTAT